MNASLQHSMRFFLCVAAAVLPVALGTGQEAGGPVRVVIKDAKHFAAEVPIDPQQRIDTRYGGGFYFGLSIEGTRITCTPDISVMPMVRIDNQVLQPGFDMNGQQSPQQPLPPGPFGRKRLGTQTKWVQNGLQITQLIEVVPSRLSATAAPDQKRRLDTVRVTYLAENKDVRDHSVEFRTFIDTMIANNDGALFASPTTAPGEVLDGVALQDKTLPEYIQVLENPNVLKPGFVATLTLKFGGKVEGASKVVLCNTAGFNGNWDVPPQKANGDSAVFLYWGPKNLKPKEKRSMVWAYGGGIPSSTENDDNVSLSLSGSFEPGKLFTVLATVDDPLPGQSLTLELPAGMERVEGKEQQPVPAPQATGTSAVLWKARALRLGDFDVKVRSSTGVTQIRNVSIQSAR
jgi:hypothetical protein